MILNTGTWKENASIKNLTSLPCAIMNYHAKMLTSWGCLWGLEWGCGVTRLRLVTH